MRICSFVGIAAAVMLTVIYSTPGFAWYYYASADDRVREEIPTDRETLPIGTVISVLPNGAKSIIIERTQYFISGENWFLPMVTKEGVKFQVVFAPL